ncbi:MAG TPA: tyrosine-type recombinase/integrase [Clostridia bacterium]|nr:tyrosine-type recombinase/integrase [Clostridia bacterium]
MSLTLRPDSSKWYGKFRLPNGKFQVKNLNVPVEGTRPPTLWENGDADFEASRKAAQKEHDKLLGVMQNKREGIKFAKAQLELVTAKKHISPRLEELPDQWAKDHRIAVTKEKVEGEDGKPKAVVRYEGALSLSHVKHSRGALAKFARFMSERFPEVDNMARTTGEQVQAFMASVDGEKLSDRTSNYYLVLLREMFARHEPDTSAFEYLRDTEERDEGTTHRKPYAKEQLEAIYEAAKEDEFIRPIVMVGMNTPLRLGDSCQLLWRDVDLDNRFLTIKRTSKTNEGVQIPIWPQLYEELHKRPQNNQYVFPGQAKMYQENPFGINSRLKAIFEKAGVKFYRQDPLILSEGSFADLQSLANRLKQPQRPVDEWLAREASADTKAALAAFEGATSDQMALQTALLLDLNRILGGPALHDQHRFGGVTLRPETEALLAERPEGDELWRLNRLLIEDAYPVELSREQERDGKTPVLPAKVRGQKHSKKGPKRIRSKTGPGRRSVPGPRRVNETAFQAFRVTYVTRALMQGVNEEVLRKATGHRTVDIVRKHYFQPAREVMRAELDKGRPDFGAKETPPVIEKMRKVLRNMRAKRWKDDRDQLLNLLEGIR